MKKKGFILHHDQFISNITKESAYLMGFIWGDGYLCMKDKTIRMEIIKKDLLKIKKNINKTGHWSFTYRGQNNSKDGIIRQPQAAIYSSDKVVFNILCNLGYNKKSYFSHEKALKYIPDNLKYYWLRGYFDADGCIYYNAKNSCCQSTFCSSYEQDWSYLSIFLTSQGIQNTIIYRIQGKKQNKHSVIRIVGKENCQNLFKLIYPNFIYDGIGLPRKFKKFSAIDYIKHKPWSLIN